MPAAALAAAAARLATRRSYTAASKPAASLAALAPLLPAGPERGVPAPAGPASSPALAPSSPAASSLQWRSAGLSPQQAFAAHSAAQLGLGEGEAGAEADPVAALLRQHLEEAFSPAADAPAGMCAPPGAGRLRASAAAVAARLFRAGTCSGPPPQTLEAALQPSPQPRLLVETQPPHAVAWANAAWEELAGEEWAAVTGQPCMAVVQPSADGADGAGWLREALAQRARGAALVECGGQPVRVTVVPLAGDGSSPSRMLLTFDPVPLP